MHRRTYPLALTLALLSACGADKDAADTGASDSDATATAGVGTTSDGGSGGQETVDPQTSTAASVTVGDPDPTTSTTAPPPGTSASPTTAEPGTTGAPDPTNDATTGDPVDPWESARQRCVDEINMYRGTLGLPPYQRWDAAEVCVDEEALLDGQANQPHGSFGMCGESAQNECPGYGGPVEDALVGCLAQMWAEGPGEDFNKHGHYINMSSQQYTRVACGFAEVDGSLWMAQDFQ